METQAMRVAVSQDPDKPTKFAYQQGQFHQLQQLAETWPEMLKDYYDKVNNEYEPSDD
jgi:hypothetical protein